MGDGTNLVLSVYSRLDLAGLDEPDDLLLEILRRPAECTSKALQLDRRKWLEVQHKGTTTNQVGQVEHVRPQEEVDIMSRLWTSPISISD